MNTDTWDPAQYERFERERARPFDDLLALLQPVPGGTVLDLGCGPGTLTVRLHDALAAGRTIGVDNSDAMLERASAFAAPDRGLTFEAGDLRDVDRFGDVDGVVASASLQWVPDHAAVIGAWRAALRPGGQLAVQVPANPDHPSHRVSTQLSNEEPFLSAFGGAPPPDPVADNVLDTARYAEILDELGAADQHVRLQVYGHHLPSTADVVEWVKGTSLTRFKAGLSAEQFDEFVAAYRERLLGELGERAPYFYAFKRILMWARF